MNPFSGYRIVDAESIIRANIHPNNIASDVQSLSTVLSSLIYLTKSNTQSASRLHKDLIQRLRTKEHLLRILEDFGYALDAQGDYVYQQTSSAEEKIRRENATNELKQFFECLKKIKDGSLTGINEFLNSRTRPSSTQSDYSTYVQQSPIPSPRLPPRSRPVSPLPNAIRVQEGNQKTIDKIASFKRAIVPAHGGRPGHSFIRRKLLLLLFQQIYPDSAEFGDENIDSEIDQYVRQLKIKDRNQSLNSSDEVYYECLLRMNLDENAAFEMLRNNRPNLQPPPEPEIPRRPTTTTLASSIRRLRQHMEQLNRHADENRAPQLLLHEGDEWKNATHIIAAIQKLRQNFGRPLTDSSASEKIHRMIYSELSNTIGPQSELKIELLSYALCNVSMNSIQNLNIADIKDILGTVRDVEIHENFGDNLEKALSAECPICAETFPRGRMEAMYLCDHMCCLDCAKGYFRDVIKDIGSPEALPKLTCFQEQIQIPDDARLNFFQYMGTKFNQWFTDERLILDQYQQNLFLATRGTEVKKCSNPKCAAFFHIGRNNNRVGRAQCPHCQYRQCQLCCRKWFDNHSGLTCEQYADWLFQNDPDDPEVQLLNYLNTAGMICPNERCKEIYEYQSGGCEHFTCKKCGTEFCRICSALFCNPAHNKPCTRADCSMKNSLHAHCCYNCFREIRDAEVDEFIELLTSHNINVIEEVRKKPEAENHLKCPVQDCTYATSAASENRFCDRCYKQFLGLLVWRNQIEPWTLNTEGNLRQKLVNASVAVPENATKDILVQLAHQHLARFLGKPKRMERRK